MAQTPSDKSIGTSPIKLLSKTFIPISKSEDKKDCKIVPLPKEPINYDKSRGMFFYGSSLDQLSSNSRVQQQPVITGSAVIFTRESSEDGSREDNETELTNSSGM